MSIEAGLLICQICKQHGLESNVYENGSETKTLIGHQPYWDKKGQYHDHDPNWLKRAFRCSNDHFFIMKYQRGCCEEHPGEILILKGED